MSRSRKRLGDGVQTVAFKAPASLVNEIDKLAAADLRTRSFTIRKIVCAALGVAFSDLEGHRQSLPVTSLRGATHGE